MNSTLRIRYSLPSRITEKLVSVLPGEVGQIQTVIFEERFTQRESHRGVVCVGFIRLVWKEKSTSLLISTDPTQFIITHQMEWVPWKCVIAAPHFVSELPRPCVRGTSVKHWLKPSDLPRKVPRGSRRRHHRPYSPARQMDLD